MKSLQEAIDDMRVTAFSFLDDGTKDWGDQADRAFEYALNNLVEAAIEEGRREAAKAKPFNWAKGHTATQPKAKPMNSTPHSSTIYSGEGVKHVPSYISCDGFVTDYKNAYSRACRSCGKEQRDHR